MISIHYTYNVHYSSTLHYDTIQYTTLYYVKISLTNRSELYRQRTVQKDIVNGVVKTVQEDIVNGPFSRYR